MSENSILKDYRSPAELRIQWMRLEGVYTEAEILASIENGEVESLEQEQIHFNSMLQLTCARHSDYIKSKIDRIFADEIHSIRLYA